MSENQALLNTPKNTGAKKAPGVTANPEEFYAKLIISKQRRRGLVTILTLFFVIFTSLISQNLLSNTHWMMIVCPVIMVGGLICLLPPTEEWLYKPWQIKARQYERHTIDR